MNQVKRMSAPVVGSMLKNNANKLKVLDGGTGTQLELEVRARIAKEKNIVDFEKEKRAYDETWSTGLMLKHPDLLTKVHLDYLKAGSRVITTNTYTAVPEIAAMLKMDLGDIIKTAVTAANDARSQFFDYFREAFPGEELPVVEIAGSVPPLRTSFRPDMAPTTEVIIQEYEQILEHLVPHVDIVQIETLSSIREAVHCVETCMRVVNDARIKETLENNNSNDTIIPVKQIWLGVAVYEDAQLPSDEKVSSMLKSLHVSVEKECERVEKELLAGKKEKELSWNFTVNEEKLLLQNPSGGKSSLPSSIVKADENSNNNENNNKSSSNNSKSCEFPIQLLDGVNFNCSMIGHIENAMDVFTEWDTKALTLSQVESIKSEQASDVGHNTSTYNNNYGRLYRFALGGYPNKFDHTVKQFKMPESTSGNKNGGEEFWNNCKFVKLDEKNFAERVYSWKTKYHARHVGACCEYGPSFIQALSLYADESEKYDCLEITKQE